jgi:dTDP-glucose 4,6-dehydratase
VRSYFHTYGYPCLITRCSNNYGPYQFPEKLIPLLITKAVVGQPLPIYGDGLYTRDWIHVHDHCTALDRVLNPGHPADLYPHIAIPG